MNSTVYVGTLRVGRDNLIAVRARARRRAFGGMFCVRMSGQPTSRLGVNRSRVDSA